jgi:hypothetical protein
MADPTPALGQESRIRQPVCLLHYKNIGATSQTTLRLWVILSWVDYITIMSW